MPSSPRAACIAFALAATLAPFLRAQESGDVGSLAAFQVHVTAPYGLYDSHPQGLPLVVENARVPGAVTEQTPLGFLPAHLRLRMPDGSADPRPTPSFTLKPLIAAFPEEMRATLRLQRGANQFQSPWVVVLADPRASVRWTPAIADKRAVGCRSCERPPQLANKTEADGVYELWAHGRSLLISGRPGLNTTYEYMGQQQRLATHLVSVIADTVRVADRVLPSKTPPFIGGQAVNNVLMHSGELVRDAVDLSIRGRGFDFVLQRFYSSAVYSFGPLGRNFDSPLFARVVSEPDGSLSYYDGTGRVDRFERSGNGYIAPHGVFLDVRASSGGGVVVRYPDGTMLFFDALGRLAKMLDRNVTMADESDGNVMRFSYNEQGRLASVLDATGRAIQFSYYSPTYSPTGAITGGAWPGLLSTVTDFDGRVVQYAYDAFGRLAKVTGPDPQSARSEQQVTSYTWGPAPTSGNFRLDVLRSGQITSERDGEGRTIYTATYAPGDAWRVESLATGGGTWTYSQSGSAMTVTDPNGHPWKYTFDANGRVTGVEEPGGATTQHVFDGEGRLSATIRPMGTRTPLTDAISYSYDPRGSGGDKRPMLNVTAIVEIPRVGSPEAAVGVTRATTVQYDARNLPTVISRPGGAATTIVRDARGNATSITDAAGVTTTFTFNERGQVRTIVAPRAGTATYAYETTNAMKNGYLKSVTTTDGTTAYAVDNRGNLVQAAKAGGATVTYVVNKLDQVEEESGTSAKTIQTYDGAGALVSRQVLASSDPGTPTFSTTQYAIDELGRVRTRTEDGQPTTYGYDPAGNIATVAAPGVAQVVYGYDLRDRVVSVTQGSQATQFAYDLNGVQTAVTNARGKTTSFALDGFGNRVGVTDPAGISTVHTLDAEGRPLDIRAVKRVSDTERYILKWTQLAYDGAGRITRETKKRFAAPLRIPDTGDPSGATDIVTQTIYDDAAQKLTRLDPRGNTTVLEFDEAGRLTKLTDAAGNITETTYDDNGNAREETLTERRSDGSVETFITRNTYDLDNRLVLAVDMNHPRQAARAFKYDARGNRTEETDASGQTTTYEYDVRGNRRKQIDPEGGVTEFRYDEADRVEWVKDANGNETTYDYDDYGNLVAETRADGAAWSFTYDENNNRKTVKDPNGTVVTDTHDDMDRLATRQIARAASVLGPSRMAFARDDLGRLTGAETDDGVKTFVVYDSVDQPLTETVQIGSGPARTVTSAYDLAGNIIKRTYPSGLSVTQAFGVMNRTQSISEGTAPLVTYEDVGTRLVARVLANGIRETRTYDPSGHLQAIEDRLASELVRGLHYGWSAAGQKITVMRPELTKRWTYGRNRNGWITGERVDRTDTEMNPMLLSTTYELDDALNIRRVVRTEQGTTTAATATFDTVVNRRNQYTSFGGANLAYDRNGNLQNTGGAQLQYDYENRLKKATLANGTQLQYLYDAAGRKVAATTTVGTMTHASTYVVSAGRVLEEYANGSLVARYVPGRAIDEVVRAERSSGGDGVLDQTFFPLQDELANVDRLTDAAGQTIERYEYEGYGKVRVFDGAGTERAESVYGWRWLFQGREYDRALGAYDFRARTLWPELGRFGQEDPARTPLPELPNVYQSFRASFADRTDPTGRFTLDKSTDTVLVRGAITRARLIYQAYGLASVYKRINRNANAKFLDLREGPPVSAGSDGGGVMGVPAFGTTRVVINPALLTRAVSQTAAAGVLVSGLLHEQAHVEAKNVGILENGYGFVPWFGTSYIPDYDNHRGYWIDRVIYDGGLTFYNPDTNELQFASSYAQTATAAQQIDHIRRAKRRFTEWYGNVSGPQTGIVFDHAKKIVREVDPQSGKSPQQRSLEKEAKEAEEWLKSMGIQ